TANAADGSAQIALTKTPFNQERHPSWSQSAILPFAQVPAIQGEARVGRPLYAPQPSWVGASPATTVYQWRRNGSDIAGAASATYTPEPADAGAQITVAVTATSTAGSRTLVSAPTVTVAAAAPYATSLPIVTGTPQQA